MLSSTPPSLIRRGFILVDLEQHGGRSALFLLDRIEQSGDGIHDATALLGLAGIAARRADARLTAFPARRRGAGAGDTRRGELGVIPQIEPIEHALREAGRLQQLELGLVVVRVLGVDPVELVERDGRLLLLDEQRGGRAVDGGGGERVVGGQRRRRRGEQRDRPLVLADGADVVLQVELVARRAVGAVGAELVVVVDRAEGSGSIHQKKPSLMDTMSPGEIGVFMRARISPSSLPGRTTNILRVEARSVRPPARAIALSSVSPGW